VRLPRRHFAAEICLIYPSGRSVGRRTMRLAAAFALCAALVAPSAVAPLAAASADAVAVVPSAAAPFTVDVVTDRLDYVWAIAFLPDGSMLVSEKPGRLRRVTADGSVSATLRGVPPVVYENQGGLLDVALHPDFAANRWVYFTYSRPRNGGSATALARGVLTKDMTALRRVEELWTSGPSFDGPGHFGSRIAFDRRGFVYVTTGDRQQYPPDDVAQRRDNTLGKIVRLRDDGSIPADNPFVGENGVDPAIWSYGHRNPQGLAFDPESGRLFEVEHGPRGGDELNIVRKGRNYGWPVVSWGVNYDGSPVGTGKHRAPGMANSIRHWTPVIAPGGMAVYDGRAFGRWRGDILIGGLVATALVRLEMDGDRVVREQRFLAERGRRIRTVAIGPDGFVYVGTDESPAEILRLKPR
jgi:glucose/arabinose dehydrogenase